MKIVKIIGGIGNQMFQFAFFKYLQKKGVYVKIDISDFRYYDLHNGLELEKVFAINIKSYIANDLEISKYKDSYPLFKVRRAIDKIFFNNRNFLVKKSHFIESNYSKYYSNIHLAKHSYLEGYWQNENYINHQKNELIELFHWQKISSKNLELVEKIRLENSVSIHIRRFDSFKSIRDIFYTIRLRIFWRVAPIYYYNNSIEYIQKNVHEPKFYIFSNNFNWVKTNFQLDNNTTLVDWNRNGEDSQDIFLMANCKHNIISMSTFSWWGAWLNQNKSKIVIAPKKWAVRFQADLGIIPEKWIRI